MRIDLTRVWPRIFFLAFVLLPAGTLIFFGGKAYLAGQWNASSRPELWLKAARLEPDDAEYWSHVGLERQWDPGSGSSQQPVSYLETATRVDPRSAELWMELADAYQTAGDRVRARQAYEKAQEDYPISAEVAWRYGSLLLYEGNVSGGYKEIRRALEVEPALATNALAECWQSNPNIDPILDSVLPARSEYYSSAIDFFLSQNQSAPALAVWNRQLALGLPVKLPEAIPLVNALIDQDRIADAQQTWHQVIKAGNWPQDPVNDESLVFNDRFEEDIANGGFDWREVEVSGARFDFDSQIVHSSSRALRIQFDGTANLDFQNLFQYVPVQPRTRYHFSAYVRTEEISTDSGVRFELLDPRHPSQVQVLTPNVVGTNPWTQVEADIVTGPDTDLLEIVFRRIPSWKFDNKLSGTVWIDDVRLSAKDGSG